MKIKSYIFADFINIVLKVLVAFWGQCYTVLADAFYNLFLVVLSFFGKIQKENKKYEGVLTSVVAFLYFLLSFFFLFFVFHLRLMQPRLFILVFLLLFFVIKYSVNCFMTTKNYNLRKGLLYYANDKSNASFVNYGIVLLVVILSKFSKWVGVFKYADRVGVVLILLLLLYKIVKVIKNSFKVMEEGNFFVGEEVKQEILKRQEIVSIERIELHSFGGVRSLILEAKFNNRVSLVDINTFMLTLGDYLLKVCDVCYVVASNKEKLVKRVSSHAGNSGSRNSKKNTKGKNTRKKNKKR